MTTQEANIGSGDRFIYSDETVTGDPMRYATFQNIRDRMFDLGNTDSTANDDDLILICDSSTTGCPQERMKASDLRTYMNVDVLSDDTPDSLQPDQSGSAGTSTTTSRSDHSHAIASSSPQPIGLNNSEGSFTSFARTDHIHAGITATAPESLTPDNANALGTVMRAARSDHVHGVAAAPPLTIGTANSEGTGTSFARSDHVHDIGNTIVNSVPSIPDTVTVKLQTTDQILVADDSEGDDDRKLSWSAVAGSLAGTGIGTAVGADSSIALLLDIHETGVLTGSLADDDRIAIANESAGDDITQHMLVSAFREEMRPTEESLIDTLGGTGRAINGGVWTDAQSRFDLGRAITTDDDDKWMEFIIEVTNNLGTIRNYATVTVRARGFRALSDQSLSGTSLSQTICSVVATTVLVSTSGMTQVCIGRNRDGTDDEAVLVVVEPSGGAVRNMNLKVSLF